MTYIIVNSANARVTGTRKIGSGNLTDVAQVVDTAYPGGFFTAATLTPSGQNWPTAVR